MSIRFLFSILLLLLLLSIQTSHSTTTSTATTASDVLRSYGLPIGLLPKTPPDASQFTIDAATGRFTLRLGRPCVAAFETRIRYDQEVSGVISYGQISSLSGVSVQELFLWLTVRLIRVDVPSSGLIYFDVGVVIKQFSLSMFDTAPDCAPLQAARAVI